ncbi:unnamed protein product [Rotaria magnacalcarata]|uniref:NAD(P)(+)--arginine ADP-ribosyltransferase n=1 Tax=Rotaria magnacalcarata TaxID=392030 RepID=A0A815K868_9BILA|nr:unnamed protein product [Rotaria magnacalcarata]
MSENESLVGNIITESLTEDYKIFVPEYYIIIWLDFNSGEPFDTSNFTYEYLWQNVDMQQNRFTDCVLCYHRILSLQDRHEKLFLVITDPKKPMIQRDLFLLLSRLMYEPQVSKIYIIETKFDFTFYRYWLRFKKQQQMFFIPNESLLLEKLTENRVENTIVICLNTGKSEIMNLSDYKFARIFSNADECFNYIVSNRHQQMILVINSQNSNVFTYSKALSLLFSTKYYIYMLSILSKIYILTKTRSKQMDIKETDFFTNFGLFQKQLENDISPNSPYQCNNEVIYSSSLEILQMSLRSVSTERFYYYTNLIAKMLQTPDAKREMIEECKQYYRNDQCELKKIDKFVNEYYEKHKGSAIWWYTHDSFLYRRLNDACRTEDIDLIYTFRNFISDLLQQLQEEYKKFYEDICGVRITVYRGQWISSYELKQLRNNIGSLYSINTFLSTTGDLNVALRFTDINCECSQLQAVVFQYNIDTSIITKRPYADIRLLSSKPSEEEVMFSMGTIFEIQSIEQKAKDDGNKNCTYWSIEMKLVNEDEDERIAPILKNFEINVRSRPALILLGDVAARKSRFSNDFCKAEQYYRLYLDEVLTMNDKLDYTNLMIAYRSLGYICRKKGDYAASIGYHEEIIKICSSLPCSLSKQAQDSIRLSEIPQAYRSIAYIYHYCTLEYKKAVNTYKELLKFLRSQHSSCKVCLTNTIHTIGDVFKARGHLSEALEFYRKAYVLNINDTNYDRTQLDDTEEKLSKMQSRYPELLFLMLLFIWCFSYSFHIWRVDEIMLQNFMPLSLIHLVIYYTIRYSTKKGYYRNRRYLTRFNEIIGKIKKQFKSGRIQQRIKRFLRHDCKIIPPFISFPTQQWFLFIDKNRVNKQIFSFIAGILLLAVYLPNLFLLVTRILMIMFIATWLSDFNVLQCFTLFILCNYCHNQILLLLLVFIVLLEFDLELVAEERRRLPLTRLCCKCEIFHDRSTEVDSIKEVP